MIPSARSNEPILSVVVPTYKGEHRILSTLRSLEQQSFRDFEVVVVIDGAVDNTEALIRRTPLNLDVQIVVQENKGRAGARNTGVRNARAEGIVFVDDDITLSPHALQAYSAYYQKGETLVVGGLWPIHPEKNDFYYFCDYLNRKWNAEISQQPVGYMSKPYMTAANAFVRKDAFLAVGAFDEALRDAEDFDLAVRLFEKGYPLYHDLSIDGGQLWQQSFAVMVKRLKEYRAAHKALRVRSPEVDKYMPFLPWRGSRMKKVAFRILAIPLLVRLVDNGFFKFMPAPMRFKFYDVILTANTADFS
jgi:glycosyltransferase involved in cell wall biosynthesis